MSQPNHHIDHQQPHRLKRRMTKVNMCKLERRDKILFSVIPFILIIIIQIRHSDSTRQSMERLTRDHDTSVLYEADPIVFNSDSLYTSHHERHKRSAASVTPNSKLVDACQSRMEVMTPYYATNSRGKLRTIVNSELMQQAIQVETCLR